MTITSAIHWLAIVTSMTVAIAAAPRASRLAFSDTSCLQSTQVNFSDNTVAPCDESEGCDTAEYKCKTYRLDNGYQIFEYCRCNVAPGTTCMAMYHKEFYLFPLPHWVETVECNQSATCNGDATCEPEFGTQTWKRCVCR